MNYKQNTCIPGITNINKESNEYRDNDFNDFSKSSSRSVQNLEFNKFFTLYNSNPYETPKKIGFLKTDFSMTYNKFKSDKRRIPSFFNYENIESYFSYKRYIDNLSISKLLDHSDAIDTPKFYSLSSSSNNS